LPNPLRNKGSERMVTKPPNMTLLIVTRNRCSCWNVICVLDGMEVPCCWLAICSGPIRQHPLTILQIIISILNGLSNGQHVGLCAFV